MALGDEVEPVQLGQPVEMFRTSFDLYVRHQPLSIAISERSSRLGDVAIVASSYPRCVEMTRDGAHLRADFDGTIVSRPGADEQTRFLPVSEAELDVLRYIASNDWVIRSSGKIVPRAAVSLGQWFGLRFDSLQVDLRYHLPLDLSQWPFRLTLFQDAWRIEQVCLYRPLVYFTAFRSPAVIEQLLLSIRSLVEIGGYKGDILVLTDRTRDTLASQLPNLEPARLWVYNTEPTDFAGYVASKYAILDIDWAAQFQPVAFMDPDIVFDADVAPLLATIARGDRISAPLEPFSPLATAPSVGSGLLQLDGLSPRSAAGVNCGTIGIPNIAAHATALRTIRTIILNRADAFGRENSGWIDQEAANYVSFRLADFDTASITPYCRFGGWSENDTSVAHRAGLVHFWPAGKSEAKVAAMRAYRERLDALLRRI